MSEMSDAEILEIVKEQICEQLDNIDPTAIELDTEFIKDLKADSLDVVELVMRLEDKFDIEINLISKQTSSLLIWSCKEE